MESYGCQHYRRKCEIEAPCCKIWYPCRLCHNDQYRGPKAPGCQVETMERRAVEKIRCLLCKKEQGVSNKCEECGEEFAKYYCAMCKFWNDNPVKGIYHCEQCGICRVGKADDYFHCVNCNGDFPLDGQDVHVCTNSGMKNNCPICFEDMFSSRKQSQRMPVCGHFIHSKCLNEYLRTAGVNRCPICSKDIVKEDEERIKYIDEVLASTRENLPKEVIDMKVNILCNNCLKKSGDIPFHFLGLKCSHCGSYNTRQIGGSEIKTEEKTNVEKTKETNEEDEEGDWEDM